MKTEIDAVDITAFLTTEEFVLEILTPDGRPTGWNVTLASPAHPQTVAWNDRQARQNLHRQKLIEQAQVNGRKYVAEEKAPDQQRRENIEWVIARIIDWTPVKIGADIISFSARNAEDLLLKPEMGWALTQLIEALGDEKRFMKRSAKP